VDFPIALLHGAWQAEHRTPGGSLVAFLTLTAGVGANAVVFGALRAAVLTPPSGADPGRLLSLNEAERADLEHPAGVSFPAYRDWREGLRGTADLAAYLLGEYVGADRHDPHARRHHATLAGVMPRGFDLPGETALYLPVDAFRAERWVKEGPRARGAGPSSARLRRGGARGPARWKIVDTGLAGGYGPPREGRGRGRESPWRQDG